MGDQDARESERRFRLGGSLVRGDGKSRGEEGKTRTDGEGDLGRRVLKQGKGEDLSAGTRTIVRKTKKGAAKIRVAQRVERIGNTQRGLEVLTRDYR